jgi:clan AA aspartic protease
MRLVRSDPIHEFQTEREGIMGLTHVTVAIRNPADLDRSWESLFLVDSGATDCMVPAKRLAEIGIQPAAQRTYELADGSEVKLDVGVGRVEFMGDVAGATVIFGPDDAEPILGMTALESVGVVIDPLSQRSKRLPAVPLKVIR